MTEDFRTIPGFENYEINSEGVIRNREGQILKSYLVGEYLSVSLRADNGKKKHFTINKLLADIFNLEIPHANTKHVNLSKNGEHYFFKSITDCAKFLRQREDISYSYARRLLADSKVIAIRGWTVKR